MICLFLLKKNALCRYANIEQKKDFPGLWIIINIRVAGSQEENYQITM